MNAGNGIRTIHEEFEIIRVRAVIDCHALATHDRLGHFDDEAAGFPLCRKRCCSRIRWTSGSLAFRRPDGASRQRAFGGRSNYPGPVFAGTRSANYDIVALAPGFYRAAHATNSKRTEIGNTAAPTSRSRFRRTSAATICRELVSRAQPGISRCSRHLHTPRLHPDIHAPTRKRRFNLARRLSLPLPRFALRSGRSSIPERSGALQSTRPSLFVLPTSYNHHWRESQGSGF